MKAFSLLSILALLTLTSNALPSFWGDIGGAISSAGHAIGDAGKQVGGAISNTGKQVGNGVASAGQQIGGGIVNVGKEVGEKLTQAASETADQVSKVVSSPEFKKIVYGVCAGAADGALTGDPTNIVLFGAMGGLTASGILDNVKINGYPVFTATELGPINVCNGEWSKRGMAEQILLLATKNNSELKALFFILNNENSIKAAVASAQFQKLTSAQQTKYIQDAANAFKGKQAVYEQQIKQEMVKLK